MRDDYDEPIRYVSDQILCEPHGVVGDRGVREPEGLKFDSDKTRIELFPGDALFAISDILTFGAKKYDDRNWELGMKWSRLFGGVMRHLWSWFQGKVPTKTNFVFGDLDAETGRSHLWHAGCCIVFLIAYEMRGVGQDDRPSTVKLTTKCHNCVDNHPIGSEGAAIQEKGGQ
jgi:hypothetical protein